MDLKAWHSWAGDLVAQLAVHLRVSIGGWRGAHTAQSNAAAPMLVPSLS